MSDLDWVEFARWNLDWIQDQIKRADEKANIHLTIYIGLSGVFVAHLVVFVSFLSKCMSLNQVVWWELVILGVVALLCLFLFGHFFWHFTLVLRPRINYEDLIGKDYKSLIFWGHIAELRWKEFKPKYLPESEPYPPAEDLKAQIYINSVIASEKYDHLKKSTRWFPLTIIATAVFVVLVYLFKG